MNLRTNSPVFVRLFFGNPQACEIVWPQAFDMFYIFMHRMIIV